MGSQEGGGGGDANGVARTEDPLSNQMTRQGSLYSLTFDEAQNQLGDLGKPLSSMNLDELLKTVWTAESSNQAMEGGGGGGGSSAAHHMGQPTSGPSNVVVLSGDMSKKTVDEVWQDIQQGQNRNFLDRKVTLGDMTLEDFLDKAGVVTAQQRKELGPPRTAGLPQQQAQWMSYHQIPSPVFGPGHPTGGNNPMMVNGTNYSENQMAVSSSSPMVGTLSGTQATGRKRVSSVEIAEKSVERRQKRMIKNRESAARSRARNQAYTQELENKVSRLEEENEGLKRQKEWEKMFPSIPLPEPKYQLRRTSSAPM